MTKILRCPNCGTEGKVDYAFRSADIFFEADFDGEEIQPGRVDYWSDPHYEEVECKHCGEVGNVGPDSSFIVEKNDG